MRIEAALGKETVEQIELLAMGVSDTALCRKLGISYSDLEATIERVRSWLEANPDDLQIQLLFERAGRRRLENSLRATQERFVALLDAMIAAVLVVDGRTGVIKQANRQCEDLFGYPEGELIGLSVEELVPPSHRRIHPAYRIGFLASVRKREMGYHPPIYGVRADGERVEMAIALTASTSDDDVMVICTPYEVWAGAQTWVEEHTKAG
jgi:PAS domain S-box-containing protein